MMTIFKSLKAKLLIAMISVVMVLITATSVYLVSSQRSSGLEQISNELTLLGGLVGTNSIPSLLFDSPEEADKILSGLTVKPDIFEAAIYDLNGERFASFSTSKKPILNDQLDIEAILNAGSRYTSQDDQGIHLFTPIISEGEIIGMVYIADNLAGVNKRLTESYYFLLFTAVAAFLASVILIIWLQRLFTIPLDHMLKVIHHITNTRDYAQRAPSSNTTEFKELSESFNLMLNEVEKRGIQLEKINAELEQRVKSRTEDLENALQLANEGNRAKTDFLAVMSHEVRTPLNGIIGYLEILSLEECSEEVAEIISSLNISAGSLLNLLNEILDFSKLDANQIMLGQNVFELGSLVRSVVESNRGGLNKKNLKLELEENSVLREFFSGDAIRLTQILNNIVNNAIKFTEEGLITVAVSKVSSQSETLVTFKISDTGQGIPENRLEDIFSPFVQVDNSITRKFGGTGLGLAICKQLIELLSGRFRVESVENQGSTFWVTLPLTRVAEQSLSENESEENLPVAAPGKILVAEDNEINQKLIKKMLETFGHEAVIANSGADVVSKAALEKYDLIYMDYHMPEISGVEATEIIRNKARNSPNLETPIVALTADIQPAVNKEFRMAGANDSLLKPVSRKILQHSINKWMHKSTSEFAKNAVIHSTAETDKIYLVFNSNVIIDQFGISGPEGIEMFKEIVELFLKIAPTQIASIENCASKSDYERLVESAHLFKSGAANIGAEKLAYLVSTIEQYAREKNLPSIRELVSLLAEYYEETKDVLQTEFCLGESVVAP